MKPHLSYNEASLKETNMTELEKAYTNIWTKLNLITGWSSEECEQVMQDLELLADALEID